MCVIFSIKHVYSITSEHYQGTREETVSATGLERFAKFLNRRILLISSLNLCRKVGTKNKMAKGSRNGNAETAIAAL